LPIVAIQLLTVGRAARAINGLARYPLAGEGARSTPRQEYGQLQKFVIPAGMTTRAEASC